MEQESNLQIRFVDIYCIVFDFVKLSLQSELIGVTKIKAGSLLSLPNELL